MPSWPKAASSIDGLVAGQVEKLAEGRDILKRALEADLNKIKGVIAAVRSRKGCAGGPRTAFSGVLEADLQNVETASSPTT